MCVIDKQRLGVYYVQHQDEPAEGHFFVSHAIEFIETPTFTRQIQSMATDDELKELKRPH